MYARSSVPDLHLRAIARVSGVPVIHTLRPLLACEHELALRALGVPGVFGLARKGKASVRYARVDNARLEEVRVRASEDTGHHRARGRPD